MLLGNYIIDHINEATKIGFEFFRNRWSERSYYAWVVRLLLEAKDVDMEDYLEQFDRFVISEGTRRCDYYRFRDSVLRAYVLVQPSR
jgi:hypothetical protein